MFKLEMFNLMNLVNQTETRDFLVFDCADLIDKINRLIDNNLDEYSFCEMILSIWLKELKMIKDIINELNKSNSSNYKLDLLKKYQVDSVFKKLLELTYNRNKYNFNISKNYIVQNSKFLNVHGNKNIEDVLTEIETLGSSGIRGNKTHEFVDELLKNLDSENKEILLNVLGRDLKIGLNIKNINKVFKNLIPKPNYMRCAVLSEKTLKKIKFPAFIQLKMDGTYREIHVADGQVTGKTRSGEEYFNPVLFKEMMNFPNGYYTGELTIDGESRFTGNGLINSLNPPYEKINFTVWDYLTDDDYLEKTKRPYELRFNTLKDILENHSERVKLVPNYEVNSIDEALKHVSDWMEQGLEGGVLKDKQNCFKNGTSGTQLKIKLKVDAEMRITGFTEGTVGTKREGKIGAIQFSNDEGTVKGQCSGFSDAELDEFTKNKDNLIGKIISVEFNDIVKSENNDYYALSHPRFIEIRNDKEESDTLEKVIQLRDMAKRLI